MQKQIFILDTSAIIGGFYSKKEANFTTNDVIQEIKDLKSSILLESTIEKGFIKIREPDEKDIKEIDAVIKASGDILRLSDVDKNIIALALKYKKKGFKPLVITDDYSMQNTLKTINIDYSSVLTDGIEEVINWVKKCKGCKKIYPSDYQYEDCEICGSPIFKKKIKIKK
ncbi:MAG: ribonuclease VapC [Methanobacterium sp.]|nr:ribonuclease VapC [Methanobacterium sp.]